MYNSRISIIKFCKFCIGLISDLCPQDVYRAHTFHSADTGAIVGGTVAGVIFIIGVIIGTIGTVIVMLICHR